MAVVVEGMNNGIEGLARLWAMSTSKNANWQFDLLSTVNWIMSSMAMMCW